MRPARESNPVVVVRRGISEAPVDPPDDGGDGPGTRATFPSKVSTAIGSVPGSTWSNRSG